MVGHPGRVGFIASPSLVPRYVSRYELECRRSTHCTTASAHGTMAKTMSGSVAFGRILRLHESTLHCHFVNECDRETARTRVDCLLIFES